MAGLRAAIGLSGQWDVAVLSKVHPIRSHSGAAQGGINAALGNAPEGRDDSAERHAFDTVKGSDYLADQSAVAKMCSLAPQIVYELERFGAPFSRFPDGSIAQRPFGGADFPRTCYAADRTGHILLQTLYEQIVKRSIRVYDEWAVVRIAVEDQRCHGVIAYDLKRGRLECIAAKYCVLATGGYGRIYRNSTNALINTGSGIGAAFLAGIPLKDLEFVQFHPTTLFGTNILITEGARGEGGYLLNRETSVSWSSTPPRRWNWPRATSLPGRSRPRSTREGVFQAVTSISTCVTWAGRRSQSGCLGSGKSASTSPAWTRSRSRSPFSPASITRWAGSQPT